MREALFSAFAYAHRVFRGTGLGKVKILKAARDAAYELLRPRREVVVTVEGLRFLVDPADMAIGALFVRDGVYEPTETALVKQILQPGMTVVDVGANIGYYTLLAASCVGSSGRVYSFEPEPTNFSLLERNIRLNHATNITTAQKAISNTSGTITLFTDRRLSGGHQIFDTGAKESSMSIEAVTLDAYFQNTVPRIDLIKIDIEGAEALALEGMSQIMRANPHVKYITEFYPAMLEKSGHSPLEYLKALQQLGFSLHIIDERSKRVVLATTSQIMEAAMREGTTNLYCKRAE